MFGLGVPELLIILAIGLIVFGAGKLPEVGRSIGQSLQEFKKATTSDDSDSKNTERLEAKADDDKNNVDKAEKK